MSDGPGDDWENLLDSGELDEKLNDIKIEKNGSSKSDGGTNLSDPDFSGPIKILTNDARHMLMSRKQEPTMKILKRPDANNSKTETQVPKALPKSLSQREAEYAEARQRILGAEAGAATGASSSGNGAQPAAGQTAPTVVASKSGSVQTSSSGKQNLTQSIAQSSSGNNNKNNRQINTRSNNGPNHNHNKRNNSHPPQHHMPPLRPNLQQPPPHGVAQLPGNFIIPGCMTPHTMYPPPPLINGGALGPTRTHFPPQFPNGHVVQQRNSHYPPQYPPPRGVPDGQGAQQPIFKLRR